MSQEASNPRIDETFSLIKQETSQLSGKALGDIARKIRVLTYTEILLSDILKILFNNCNEAVSKMEELDKAGELHESIKYGELAEAWSRLFCFATKRALVDFERQERANPEVATPSSTESSVLCSN